MTDTFIDFGLNMDLTYIREAKLRGYRTIAINDKQPKALRKLPDYYKLIVDETYIGYWSEKFDIPLATSWVNFASLEHTPKGIVEREVRGVRDKVCGPGTISIDLSKHVPGDPLLYLNHIPHFKWENIISRYFDYELDYRPHDEMIYFNNCTVRTDIPNAKTDA